MSIFDLIDNPSSGQARVVEIIRQTGCDVSQAIDSLCRERAVERREFDKQVQQANREARANGTHEPTTSDLALMLTNEHGVPFAEALNVAVKMGTRGWTPHSTGTVIMKANIKKGKSASDAFTLALTALSAIEGE
jgi:hypothetical protein